MSAPLNKDQKPIFRAVVNDIVRSFRFDINAKTEKGVTAAHHAAKRGRRWNLKVLLSFNPDVDLLDACVVDDDDVVVVL